MAHFNHVFLIFYCLLMILYMIKTNKCLDTRLEGFSTGSQINFMMNKYMNQFSFPALPRYLLYDVNPGEGFNLRRDVYLRMANLVKFLNEIEPWILVLPPWNRLYHWRTDIEQENIPWSTFFDLDSLKLYIPVIEYAEFLAASGISMIDEIYYLQHYKEGWGGEWVEKMEERPCIEKVPFHKNKNDEWAWYFPNVTAKNFKCMSIQAEYSYLKDFLLKNISASSVFLARAESVMHGKYSEWSFQFWLARRSVRFSKDLCNLADKFRSKFLSSNDDDDRTIVKKDWRKVEKKHGDALGGPYLAVHLRRGDFLYSHKEEVPSLEKAAAQINKALVDLNISKVYVATDSSKEDFKTLAKMINTKEVYRFKASSSILDTYKDGGIAIIDQWICTHARYFIGTKASTFSFRIHEEREILGFKQDTTYNCFCPDVNLKCEQPSKWKIIYDPKTEL